MKEAVAYGQLSLQYAGRESLDSFASFFGRVEEGGPWESLAFVYMCSALARQALYLDSVVGAMSSRKT